MTDVCSGGPSAPKPGTADFVQVVAQALIAAAPGFSWLLPYTKYIEPLSVATGSFCAADPPTLPTIDASDVFALVTGGRAGSLHVGIEKFAQVLAAYAWYQLCECTTVATPMPPAAPAAPANLPAVSPTGGSATVSVRMLRSQCKVLDLWNGASNSAPPAGWQFPSFDDSAWSNPPLINDNFVGLNFVNYQNNTTVATPFTPPDGDHAVGVNRLSDNSRFLIRWKFTLPYLPTDDVIWSISGADSPNIPETYMQSAPFVNGFQGIMGNPTNWEALQPRLIPGGFNVIAFQVPSVGTGVNWDANGSYLVFRLTFPGASDPNYGVSDCCARLEPLLHILSQRVAAMSELVTIIQRQHVPFAVVPGLEYPGLTGIGEVTFSDPIVRFKVELTMVPGYLGMIEGNPDALFDVGWVAIGTAQGYEPSRRITHTPFVLQVGGDITKIGYSLAPGVEAKITTYSREP